MQNPRDFLPPPPWEGPPLPEAFLRAFSLTPERIQLTQQINDIIRKRTRYGLREELVERLPAWGLQWSNASAEWRIVSLPKSPATEKAVYAFTAWRREQPGASTLLFALGPEDWRPVRRGDTTTLDANEVLVYAAKRDLLAVQRWLEPLPLYRFSYEAKERGFFDPVGWLKALYEGWREEQGG